jgi:hypothetical protein
MVYHLNEEQAAKAKARISPPLPIIRKF